MQSKAKRITFSYTLHRSITKNKLQNFFCLKQNTEDSKQQKNTSFDTTENYTVHEIFLSSNVCNTVCNPEVWSTWCNIKQGKISILIEYVRNTWSRY